MAGNLSARTVVTMRRDLALVGEPARKGARELIEGICNVVAVIALAFAGQQHVPGVMVVVVPLGAVTALRRLGLRVEQARRIVVVLEHEMNLASALRREPADRYA